MSEARMQVTSRPSAVLLLLLLVRGPLPGQVGLVERTFEAFEATTWKEGAYNRAKGETRLVEEVPPLLKDKSTRAMEIRVHYAGTGFQFYGVAPAEGKIPGRLRQVSLWVRNLEPGYSWMLKFKDANGRDQHEGRKMEVGLGGKLTQWRRVEFRIPGEWEQPIAIAAIAAHNWGKQGGKKTATLFVDELRVTTDLTGVDPKKVKLLDVRLESGMERNVFTQGEEAQFSLVVDSWLGKEIQCDLRWRVECAGGETWQEEAKSFAVTDVHLEEIAAKPPKFGVHRLEAVVKLSSGEMVRKATRFSYIPAPHSYTQSEKQSSPYGINIHGGVPGVSYKAIAKTGFTWIRDYAYSLDWLIKSRGETGKYTGWPWYDKMDAQIQESGLILLADLVGSIRVPVKEHRKFEPDREWRANLMHILASFPQYANWELDNEYDYKNGDDEAKRNWSSYAAYHDAFGKIVNLLDEKMLAVEQGTAGVYPGRTREMVLRGAFDDIDVVNAHFYCGTNAPELTRRNWNVGGEKDPPTLLFDVLREFAAAADADGKDRQAWITEFGWDTLAGHIVPERVQAAYLQRGYMLQLMAGLDKLFWYWNRDTKGEPSKFFDGCGVWDSKDEPKPASAAAAALAHFLKLPEPVGTCDFGENGHGYVFRDRSRLVASLFKLRDDEDQVEVELKDGELFDMYANSIPGPNVALSIEPVWAVGIPETSPLFLETAYDLKSRYQVQVTAGDTFAIQVRVRNQRKSSLRAIGVLTLPEGWRTEKLEVQLAAAPDETAVVPVSVNIPATEKLGMKEVVLTIREGAVTKALTTEFYVREPIAISTARLHHGPGRAKTKVTVENHALEPAVVTLKARVPATWKVEPASRKLELPASGKTEVELSVQWDLDWKIDEAATLLAVSDTGEVLATSHFVPRAVYLNRVEQIVFDGNIGDWPPETKLPAWVVGSTLGKPNADIYAGYSEKGLAFAFAVRDSKVKAVDPRLFWLQDAIEVFVDTRDNRDARREFHATDHQFWFVPLIDQGRVYAGRWRRFKEIPKTVYDLQGIEGSAKKTETGYLVELLIPASLMKGYSAQKGTRLGLNLNVTVQGSAAIREVFWPGEKGWNVLNMPRFWGLVELR